jgi:hypothetical protein
MFSPLACFNPVYTVSAHMLETISLATGPTSVTCTLQSPALPAITCPLMHPTALDAALDDDAFDT